MSLLHSQLVPVRRDVTQCFRPDLWTQTKRQRNYTLSCKVQCRGDNSTETRQRSGVTLYKEMTKYTVLWLESSQPSLDVDTGRTRAPGLLCSPSSSSSGSSWSRDLHVKSWAPVNCFFMFLEHSLDYSVCVFVYAEEPWDVWGSIDNRRPRASSSSSAQDTWPFYDDHVSVSQWLFHHEQGFFLKKKKICNIIWKHVVCGPHAAQRQTQSGPVRSDFKKKMCEETKRNTVVLWSHLQYSRTHW